MRKIKIILMVAAISGALVVGLGAIGSHALEETLAASGRTGTYQTAIRYHSFHTLAILFSGLLSMHVRSRHITSGIYLMFAGMVLFSGSLYLLSLWNKFWLVYITPAGGILLILSWIMLFAGIYKARWDVKSRG
jgi:uncharacterized membrane protein YgdD (TMEM256/DUF423 family)